MFINDLPLLLKHCFSDFFADESTIHSSATSIAKVNKELQADLEIAVAWSKQNKLPINYDKTTYMVLGTKPKEHDTYLLDLSADGNKIDKVPKQKLLGIVIDDHLSWAPHIDYLCSAISTKISLLRHISIYVPQNIQKIFYQSYIQPLLDYGCNTWGNTTAANIECLSKLKKRAARIILRADFMTPSTIMFDRLEWLSVPKRLINNKAVLTYKALNNLAPAYIYGLLKPVSETHTRSLRFLSTLRPMLQDIAHHIQDKLAISFDSSSIGLISYKWFLTIYDKYSSVKTYNEENSIFLEKKIPFQNIPNPSSACIF